MSMFPDEARRILEKMPPKQRKAVAQMIDGALLSNIDKRSDPSHPTEWKKWRDVTKWAKTSSGRKK